MCLAHVRAQSIVVCNFTGLAIYPRPPLVPPADRVKSSVYKQATGMSERFGEQLSFGYYQGVRKGKEPKSSRVHRLRAHGSVQLAPIRGHRERTVASEDSAETWSGLGLSSHRTFSQSCYPRDWSDTRACWMLRAFQ